MKTILLCILSLFFGSFMQEKKYNSPPLKISIEMPDTIYRDSQNIPLILKVENTTSEVLSIRDPAHWGNAFPHIKQGKNNIPIKKVKIDPRVFHEVIHLKENEVSRIKFDYTLDQIFNLEFHSLGEYNIYFEFFYEPKTKKDKTSVAGKFITSDTFIFTIL